MSGLSGWAAHQQHLGVAALLGNLPTLTCKFAGSHVHLQLVALHPGMASGQMPCRRCQADSDTSNVCGRG